MGDQETWVTEINEKNLLAGTVVGLGFCWRSTFGSEWGTMKSEVDKRETKWLKCTPKPVIHVI